MILPAKPESTNACTAKLLLEGVTRVAGKVMH